MRGLYHSGSTSVNHSGSRSGNRNRTVSALERILGR